MRITGTLYRIAAICSIAILAMVSGLPGISRARALSTQAVEAQTDQPATKSLSTMLNPDGTLNVPKGFTGSLNPEGFTMNTGPKGEPRFTPAQQKGKTDPAADKAEQSEGAPDSPGGYKWDSNFRARGVNGRVYAIAVSGSNVYIGGYFTSAGNMAATNIAWWEGSSWHPMGVAPNDSIQAITVSGSNVYVGGKFTQIGGVIANHIARWNGSNWSIVGSGINNGVNGNINALASIGSYIYAGGFFSQAGGNTASNIARWNGSSWESLGSGVNNVVNALVASGTALYVGGGFTAAGGYANNYVALWTGTNWMPPLGSGLAYTPYNVVNALAVSGSDLYVGGYLTQAGGQTVNGIARWSGSGWSPLGSGVDIEVDSLAASGSTLYVGGDFYTAGGISVNGLARWDGSAWSAVLGYDCPFALDAVDALAATPSGTGVYIGGTFISNGINGFALFDGSQWLALKSGNGVDDDIFTVAVQDNGTSTQVYIGGIFSYAGDIPVNNIARWDGSTWNAMGSGLNNTVESLAVSGNNIYAGGVFTKTGSLTVNHVAKWNGTTWSSLVLQPQLFTKLRQSSFVVRAPGSGLMAASPY